MNYQLLCKPTYSALEVQLQPGEKIVAEAGAMSWMSPTIKTETSARGGVMAGLSRAFLTGESFFQNIYSAEGGPGEVGLVPGAPGDIVAVDIEDELYLEKGAYLASDEGVKCNAKWDGLRGLFNEGMFVLKVDGRGKLFFNCYGAAEEIDVNGEYIVDNGYAVAWEPSLEYKIVRGGKKIRSFLFSDQLVLRFRGHGKLWVQSRSPRALAAWAYPFRPVKSKN
ncbi:MAG: TIGR00266 family protein [Planctomycetaceae bacterium]|nr:TIGR00266 family protein [Planctomycetaceae bacterium]